MVKSPIQYYDGGQWRYWNCYQENRNSKAILVCGGPSLNDIDTDKLVGPGKTVFGINNTYPKVRPDIWIGMDDPHCYHRHVFYESFPKILRGGYDNRTCEDVLVRDLDNVYFASSGEVNHKADIFHKIDKHTSKFVWHKSVFHKTLNIMMYMGYREIYIAGCDFDNSKADYYEGDKLTADQKTGNQKLYNDLNHYLKWLSTTAEYAGFKFYSLSPGSCINEYMPFVTVDELNDSIELPELGKMYHCKDIEPKDKSEVVSKEYKEILQQVHRESVWGVTAQTLIPKIRPLLDKYDVRQVLDYGAGSGGFKRALADDSIKVFEYDPGIPGKDISPAPREFVVCIDVLEHIEPDKIDGVLEDLARVTEGHGFFTISLVPARRILPDGRNAHLIVESPSWWWKKLSKHFTVLYSDQNKIQMEVEVKRK